MRLLNRCVGGRRSVSGRRSGDGGRGNDRGGGIGACEEASWSLFIGSPTSVESTAREEERESKRERGELGVPKLVAEEGRVGAAIRAPPPPKELIGEVCV